jgi:hypothetical protein
MTTPAPSGFLALAPVLAAAAVLAGLLALGSALWWLAAMALLALAARPQHWPGVRGLAQFWAIGAVAGALSEALRAAGGLWSYAPALDTPGGAAALIFLGYPLILMAAAGLHARLRPVASAGWALALTIAGVVAISELPGALVPLWRVPESLAGLVVTIHVIGYPALILLAIAAWTTITGTARTGPTDSWRWRFLRVVTISLFRDALRRVLGTREVIVAGTAQRLDRAGIDRIIDRLEAATAALRPHVDMAEYPTAGNRMMVELALFTLAAQMVLTDNGLEPDQASQAVTDTGWLVYAQMLGATALPARLTTRDPAERLRRTIRQLMRFPFSAPGAPGYAVQATDLPDGIRTDFTHCPPQTAARRVAQALDDDTPMDCFRASWCQYDWPGADLIAADGQRDHYSRPHTLSRGDPVCDMCWAASPRTATTSGT